MIVLIGQVARDQPEREAFQEVEFRHMFAPMAKWVAEIDSAGVQAARRHIELRVVPRHTVDEGGVIEFSVTDMGPGLKEEVIARLYEAFFSTKAEGLGIGLSLCRSIVESHRGRMRAENLYNGASVVGCRFSFTLPVELPVRAEGQAAGADTVPNPAVTSE